MQKLNSNILNTWYEPTNHKMLEKNITNYYNNLFQI